MVKKEESFWNKVEMIPFHECYEWIFSTNQAGYGHLRIDKKLTPSHRFSYELHYGKIPKGLCVLHKCDNRKCVRPEHLFLGTHKDNAQDRNRKNRQSKGQNRPGAKLTDEKVRLIRQI